MALTLNTNIQSLFTRQALYQAASTEATAMERLATGKRINSAEDDAAGLYTTSKQEMDIRASNQIAQGLNDGISYSQTAEGALSEIQKLLSRAREIAVQSSNGAIEDRSGLVKEWDQIKAEIDRIVSSTEILGFNPLQNSTGAREALPDGLPMVGTSAVSPANGDVQNVGSSNPYTFNNGEVWGDFGAVPSTFNYANSNIGAVGIQAGYKNIELQFATVSNVDTFSTGIAIFTRDGKQLAGQPLSHAMWSDYGITSGNVDTTVLKSEFGFYSDASYDASNLNSSSIKPTKPEVVYQSSSYNGTDIDYGRAEWLDPSPGNPKGVTDYIEIPQAQEDLIVIVLTSTTPTIGFWAPDAPFALASRAEEGEPVDTGNVKILTDTRAKSSDSSISLDKTAADTASLSIDALDFSTQAGSQVAIDALENAITTVSGHQAYYGAMNNRFGAAQSAIKDQQYNLEQSKSRVEDTDFAKETAQLTRSQILKQAAMGMVSQANSSQNIVLSLLKSVA